MTKLWEILFTILLFYLVVSLPLIGLWIIQCK